MSTTRRQRQSCAAGAPLLLLGLLASSECRRQEQSIPFGSESSFASPLSHHSRPSRPTNQSQQAQPLFYHDRRGGGVPQHEGVGQGTGVKINPRTDIRALRRRGQAQAVGFDKEDETSELSATHKPTTFRLICRAIYLAYLFSAAIFTAILAYFSSAFRDPYWYRMIVCAISKSGAALIKWGQWASARPDMFPDSLCSLLAMLHSFAPSHSFEHSRTAVEEAFGMPLESAFEWFDHKPVASGSIAQVHKAVYKGQKVAVKVRHPGVGEQIDMDFRIMRKIAQIADNFPATKFLNLGHSMEQFSHTLGSQTRLDIEGMHLLLLNHNFRNWKTIGFPRPFFMSQAIIVESWEDGVIISEFVERYSKWREHKMNDCEGGGRLCGKMTGAWVQLRHFAVARALDVTQPIFEAFRFGTSSAKAQREVDTKRAALRQQEEQAIQEAQSAKGKELVTVGGGKKVLSFELAHFIVSTGEDLYLKMLLCDNLMHADLHPGNILIYSANGRPRLTLVDAGMVARLTEEERENFIGLLEAMGAGDGVRAAGHVLGFSVSQTCQGDAAWHFTREIKEIFEVHCRGYGTDVKLGTVLRAVLGRVRKYQVRVDVNYATLIINLLCLESLAAALLPEYNLLDRAKPLLSPHSKRFLKPIFRSLFPVLLVFKRFSESALFGVLRAAQVVESPDPRRMGFNGNGKQPALPPGGSDVQNR